MDVHISSADIEDVGWGFTLPETESQLRQMIAALPGMLWTANADGQIDFVSAQWLVHTGMSLPDLLGCGWIKAIHADDREAIHDAWRVAVTDPQEVNLEYRLLDHAGAARWFSARATPILDEKGRVTRWFGLCIDIDDLKRTQQALRESERRYSALFENKTNGIAHMHVLYDDAGSAIDVRIEKINEAYTLITGLTPEQVEGRLLTEVFPDIQYGEFDYMDTYGRIARDGSETSFVVDFTYLNQWLAVYAYSSHPGECIAIFTDITAQKKAEAALRESEEYLKCIIENLAEGLIVVDPDGTNLRWNRMALEMHGYTEQEERFGQLADIANDYVLLGADGLPMLLESWPIPRLLRGEALRDFEATLCNTRHHWTRILSYGGTLVRNSAGIPIMGLLTIRDTTERRQAEMARADAERRLQMAVDIAHLGFWEWEVGTDTVYFSPQWKKLLGYSEDEIVNVMDEWSGRLHPDDRQMALDGIAEFVRHPQKRLQLEYRMRHRNGTYSWVIAQAIANVDAEGHTTRLIGTMLDVTEQKLVEQRVREAAQHDPLTGLPNRALIFEYAGHLLAAAGRKHSRGALLFIDLDRFKPINDLYGHEVGDRLLKEVAHRLISCVRHEDVIGRIGGDEFVIVLPYTDKGFPAATVAQHVLHALSQPFQIDELDLSISASVGISFFPQHGTDVDTLLHNADLAMYQAKETGRGSYQVYTSELSIRIHASSSIEARLKDGLSHNSFRMHYQPVIDMETGKMIGAEALLRLPLGGDDAVGPDRFIPIAESAGLISQLGDWVATEICRQHSEWRIMGLPPIVIAMNVSPLQFRQRGFVERLLEIVNAGHLEPRYLQIEVTESTVMESVDDAALTLGEIHTAGIRIALDDFGTGYSSLSYLSNLPLDKLKVDQSFVQRLAHDKASQAITDAIIALGKTLNLEVVGEGIESEQSLDYLRQHGCGQAQGNWFSRPLPPAEFVRWYREHAS